MNDQNRLVECLGIIKSALESASYVASSEAELAAAIHEVLRKQGIKFEVEVDLGAHGRIDVLAMRIGIEIKFRYGISEVLRQLDRYAGSPLLDALILATASRRLAAAAPESLRGKPVEAVVLEGGL